MTSSATQPARGAGGRRAEGRGYGLVFFASVLLVMAIGWGCGAGPAERRAVRIPSARRSLVARGG